MPTPPAARRWAPFAVLAIAVLVVSSAAIIIRLLQQPPYALPSALIAAGRLTLATLLLLPLVLLREPDGWRRIGRRDVALAAASGVFLAVHFASWIASLEYTSVASSVALVTTNPIWVALAAALFLGERPARGTLIGVALTIAGSLVIIVGDRGSGGSDSLLGNGLALLGAASVSGYFLLGRALQRRISTLWYVTLVYGAAALVLLAMFAWQSGARLAAAPALIGPGAALLLLALAAGPQVIGHTAFNWSLKRLSPTFIALALLGEPIGSAVLAYLAFGEGFRPLQLLGFVVLLGGIVVAARDEGRT